MQPVYVLEHRALLPDGQLLQEQVINAGRGDDQTIALPRALHLLDPLAVRPVQGIGNPPDADPPRGLDWDMWVGPAPLRPFNPLIVAGAYQNCSFMDFSGGWTPGMAPHIIDLPYWALQLDHPTVTCCSDS